MTPGQVFKTVDEIERFIMRLQIDHHHPLKVYMSEQLNLTIRKYSNNSREYFMKQSIID